MNRCPLEESFSGQEWPESSAPVVFLFDGDNQRKCDLGVNTEADSRVHHQEIPCSRFLLKVI